MPWLRVLGGLEVGGAAGPIPIGAPKLRQVLALLAVCAGDVRSAGALVDELWGGSPPASAEKLLQVYVSRLRKLLPPEGRIETRGSGYRLELTADGLDAALFASLADEGRRALAADNPRLAGSLLRQALSLWRGEAYRELTDLPSVMLEATRLEDRRLAALEDRLQADLDLGRHHEVSAELCALADSHPLRERLQSQAMVCLYRAGRQTDALARGARLRTTLDQEFGLRPGRPIRELEVQILNHDPALAAPASDRPQGGLPVPTTPILGRDRELAELGELLGTDPARLVVLTGAGGSGKTRLALEAATLNAHRFANGAALVELAALRDAERVPGAISKALGLQEESGSSTENLLESIARLELLLVIDNAEHLPSVRPLLATLLQRAPRLKLLVTSRSVLHLSGEHVYPVAPLAASDAVLLFAQRARAAGAAADGTPADRGLIARICERLDRLPLAIELAASRTRMLALTELFTRLEQRLPLLTAGPHDLPARQQTMAATIAWSHDLLDEATAREFRRFAIFAGGGTLEAAQAICESGLETLGSLVDGNLLRRVSSGGRSRYWMLETIREFAAERLRDSGELDRLGLRHLHHYAALAESCNLFAEAEQPQDFATANAEQANFRAALSWARATGRERSALEMAISLENFWVTHDPDEGVHVLSALLESADGLPGDLSARALRALGSSRQTRGELDAAEQHYRESREAFAGLGDEKGVAILDYRLGLTAIACGETAAGTGLLSTSLETFRRIGSRRGEAQATGALGNAALARGERAAAAELFERSAAMCEEIGRPWWQARMLAAAAELALGDGRLDPATAHATRLLELAVDIGDRSQTLSALGYLACVLARTGAPERAASIWGMLERERRGDVLGRAPDPSAAHAEAVLSVADPRLTQARLRGRDLPLHEGVSEVLGLLGAGG